MTEHCAGGIIIGDGGTVALVHNAHTKTWGFPKGLVEEGESDEEAARREIQEETGLTDLELIDDLGTYVREAFSRKDEEVLKEIHLYLFNAAPGSVLMAGNEIAEAVFVSTRDVASRLTIPKDQTFFASVFDRVREAIQRD